MRRRNVSTQGYHPGMDTEIIPYAEIRGSRAEAARPAVV
jgi:hypothetical protein